MDISAITDSLYVGTKPEGEEIKKLKDLGILLVISMLHEAEPPEYRQAGLVYRKFPTIDFPIMPISLNTLGQGVRLALEVINRGGKVLVYCKYGSHRSVAMGASILIGLGYPAGEAMALLDRQREAADPYIWYIQDRIIKFEGYWAKSPI